LPQHQRREIFVKLSYHEIYANYFSLTKYNEVGEFCFKKFFQRVAKAKPMADGRFQDLSRLLGTVGRTLSSHAFG